MEDKIYTLLTIAERFDDVRDSEFDEDNGAWGYPLDNAWNSRELSFE